MHWNEVAFVVTHLAYCEHMAHDGTVILVVVEMAVVLTVGVTTVYRVVVVEIQGAVVDGQSGNPAPKDNRSFFANVDQK